MFEVFGIKIVMLAPSGIVLLVLGGFFLTCGIAILFTLWRADPVHLAEARRLINLAKKANKGDMQARGQCNHEPDIKIRLVFKDGQFGTRCEVSWSAIRRVFGYGT